MTQPAATITCESVYHFGAEPDACGRDAVVTLTIHTKTDTYNGMNVESYCAEHATETRLQIAEGKGDRIVAETPCNIL